MNTQKILPVTVVVLAVAAGAWYFVFSGTSFDKGPAGNRDVVAIVNEENISRADLETLKLQMAAQQGLDVASLDAETENQFETQVVNELIMRTLLRQTVDKSGITVSQEEIDARTSVLAAQFGGEEVLQQALDAEGMSEETFRAQISTDLASQAYLERELKLSSVSATDEEVETVYAEAVAEGENIPPLADVREQIEEIVIGQKQQVLFTRFLEQLRAEADIKILLYRNDSSSSVRK